MSAACAVKRKRGGVDLSVLNLPDGITRPYRPKPRDFRATYVMLGWDGIAEHYGTNWRVIRRWIEQEGRDGLIAERAAYVERRRQLASAETSRRKRYVLGRTLTAVTERKR